MPSSANDQAPNLKHRLTGAVILIGLAVALGSLLLDREHPVTVTQEHEESPPESFVSRIVGDENAGESTSVPSPVTPPLDIREPELAITEPERTPGLTLEPVLTQTHELPAPSPRLNTVNIEPPQADPESTAASRPAAPPAASSRESWVVRVGAFADQSNADSIVQRLDAGGYKPSSASVQVNGRAMVRVWVGPFPDRVEATRIKSELAREYDLNGFVVRGE
jgi:DedD protein